jgi:hypothetical protein
MVGFSFERVVITLALKALKVPEYLRIENRTVRYTLYALFATVVADGLISQFLVTNGYGPEANPLLQSVVGQESFVPIKISGAFLATLLLWIKYNERPRLVNTITVVALAFYTAIVYWNLFVYFFVLLSQPI